MKILLVNYDNGSRMPVMPQNLLHLKECLRYTKCVVEIVDFNVTKSPYSVLRHEHFDVVGLGFISGYWQHQEAIKIAEVVRDHPKRDKFHFIIGGHGPSAAPKYYQKKLGADAVFVGSADYSLPDWIENPFRGIVQPSGFNADATQYYDDCEYMSLYKRIKFPNTKEDEFAIQILSGRGCPYSCTFCYRPDFGYQSINIEVLMKDIYRYALIDGVTHFQFSDELLMINESRTWDLCYALLDLQEEVGRPLFFDCNGRLNVAAKNINLLKQMQKTGFRYINYGCESMSQEVLNNINKKQTVAEIKAGIENTVSAGLSPGLNFMWGNPGETEKSLYAAMKFIIQYSDGCELRTIRPVTPYPGTKLFQQLIEENRCSGVDDFYDNHVNSDLFSYHFMGPKISNQKANKLLRKVNEQLSTVYYSRRMQIMSSALDDFYSGYVDPKNFRGFREV